MATVTSKATGLWSAGSTWDSDPAIPVNGDIVIIDTTHEVTFDVDQSGFANGVDLTVTGTFTCSTGAGTYYLMCSADIDGAGLFQAGSSGTALPFTVTFTVDFNNGAFNFLGTGGLTVNLYCTEPTNTFVALSAQEAIGQTELSVDTDVTADIWADGDDVVIADMNAGKDVEVTTIDVGGIAAGAITVVDALAAQKESGAYIVLATRNITVKGGTTVQFDQVDDSFIRCEVEHEYSASRSGASCNGTEFAGVWWHSSTSSIGHNSNEECTYSGIYCGGTGNTDAHFNTFGGTFSGLIVGCDEAMGGFQLIVSGDIRGCNIGMGEVVQGQLTATGIIDNCFRPLYKNGTCFYYGTVSNCNRACERDAGSIFSCTFTGNSVDLLWCFSGQAFNTLFGGATEFSGYDNFRRGKISYFESFDHDQVTNAFKAWCRGGIVTSQTASPPTGYTIYYEHACEDLTQIYPVYRQFETTVQPGTSIEVDGYLQIPNGEDLTAVPPALQIVDKFADPLVDSTATLLDEDEIPDPDGSETGWQAVSVIWANQGDAPRIVIVRAIAYSDTGGATDVNSAWNVADYQDQINDIHTRLGVPADIDSGGATIANNIKKLADDNGGADFDATRESLNTLRTRGDLAWVTGVGSSASNVYTISTLTRTVGDNDGGDDTDVDVVDGNLFSTGEINSGTKLEVDATFTATDSGENPLSVSIWGYYVGGGGHHQVIQAYNYVDSTFEEIGQMGIGTEVSLHSFPMNTQHINTSTGAMAIKIIHNTVGTGITSHVLHIDKITVGTTEESLLNSNVDLILEDTNEIQGKLPDNFIMGSSDTDDYNDDILSIKANIGQVHTTEDESPGGGGGAPSTTSGIAEGC